MHRATPPNIATWWQVNSVFTDALLVARKDLMIEFRSRSAFLALAIVDQRALGHRADQKLKQFWIHVSLSRPAQTAPARLSR
jgi:hypothetical protein